MAKEKPIDPEKAARKAEKKAKKEAAALAAAGGNGGAAPNGGVHKSTSSNTVGSSKKEKAAKIKAIEAEIESVDATTKLLNQLDEQAPGTVVVKDSDTKSMEVVVKTAPLLGALVPFANPLADEKVGKKVLKSVKKGMYSSISTIIRCLFPQPSSPLQSDPR